jgi:hypothetical protein
MVWKHYDLVDELIHGPFTLTPARKPHGKDLDDE